MIRSEITGRLEVSSVISCCLVRYHGRQKRGHLAARQHSLTNTPNTQMIVVTMSGPSSTSSSSPSSVCNERAGGHLNTPVMCRPQLSSPAAGLPIDAARRRRAGGSRGLAASEESASIPEERMGAELRLKGLYLGVFGSTIKLMFMVMHRIVINRPGGAGAVLETAS